RELSLRTGRSDESQGHPLGMDLISHLATKYPCHAKQSAAKKEYGASFGHCKADVINSEVIGKKGIAGAGVGADQDLTDIAARRVGQANELRRAVFQVVAEAVEGCAK